MTRTVTACKYNVNDRVKAVVNGKTFTGAVTRIGKNYVEVLPDAGQYFDNADDRRELSVPLSNSTRYGANNRIVSRA